MLAALALALAAAPATGDFSFAVVGHVRGDRDGELLQNLDEVIDEVERAKPDLVFLCGDLIWGSIETDATERATIEADWNALDAKLARLSMPVHRVPGNHDVHDVVTRDVWVERYGALPRSVEHEGSKFLLLRSVWWPPDDSKEKHPSHAIRGHQLDREQIAFVEAELAGDEQHAFVLAHHMLWWEDDAAWWREVHPLLAREGVDAVFAGDYGPLKFSQLARDGVQYAQTSIENRISLAMLRGRELSRLLSAQLDNFLLVRVEGDDVRIEVRAVGAFSTDKFTPQRFREVVEHDRETFARKVFKRMDSPSKLMPYLVGVAVAGAACGALLLAAVFLLRARSRGGA